MQLIQTIPIGDHAKFPSIRDKINALMAKRGHPLVEETGSVSWLYGAGYAKAVRRRTAFKLLVLASGEIVFAARDDLVATVPELAAIPWPRCFAIKPHASVGFRGFEISTSDPEAGVKRVEQILSLMPSVDPSVQIEVDSNVAAREAEFDRHLAALKKSSSDK